VVLRLASWVQGMDGERERSADTGGIVVAVAVLVLVIVGRYT
jgi:hypothetical protein